MARVKVLFFAALAEAAGRRETYIEVGEGEAVGRLPALLVAAFPRLDALCANVAFAVNAEYAAADRALRDGDEVALIPPVSGGCDVRDHT